MDQADHGRDRLRELLDAVLDDAARDLTSMAAEAYSSPFHLSRRVQGATGEPPVSLRRRVLLERAAWQLQRGASVTDAAFGAGFESVEGFGRAFARAYGHPPSAMPDAGSRGHWLPSPNGVHFHGPTVLYIEDDADGERPAGDVLSMLVRHDVADVRALLAAAASVPAEVLDARRLPGHVALEWAGPDETLREVLDHLAGSKRPWLEAVLGSATVQGQETGQQDHLGGGVGLADRFERTAATWLGWVRDVERRGAWGDWIVDALCEPPESFQLGQIVAHDLTFSSHRRQLARWMLREAGADLGEALDPDPIMWHRRQTGERR